MMYEEAFNRNDAAAVGARFTEDAVQVASEGVFFGRQAIEKRYAEQVFQQWHCNNHITKTEQVIAVGTEICSVGEWSCNDGDTWKTRMTTFNLVPPAETK